MLRGLVQRPGWTVVVVVTLALGIGANTALFNYLCLFFWDPFDAPEAHRLVWFRGGSPERPGGNVSFPDFLEYHAHDEMLAPLAGSRIVAASIRSRDPEIFPPDAATLFAWGNLVTGDFFPLFAARPTIGRLIQPIDDRPEAVPVLVLSHLFWSRHFGADPGVLGRTLEIDGRSSFTVIGVAPRGFQSLGVPGSFYVPMSHGHPLATGLGDRERPSVSAIGRLRPGVGREQAEAAFNALARGLDESHPLEQRRLITLEKIVTWVDQDTSLSVNARILAAVVVLFLLLACANVANLFLAHALARRREMAIRAALGASRWHLVRRLLTESLVLALSGAALGLAPAWAGLRVLERHLRSVPVGFGNWAEEAEVLAMDYRTLAFGVLASVAAALLFGLAPALRTLRADLVTPLRSEGAGSSGGHKRWPRHLLVSLQVLLSVVLLLGAGLLVRTLSGVRSVDPGFETGDLLLAAIYFPRHDDTVREAPADGSDAGPEGRLTIYRDLLDRLRALPGVRAAAVVQRPPLYFGGVRMQVLLPDRGETATVDQSVAGPGYFETFGIPLLAGRGFDRGDHHDAVPVAVVNETMARLLAGGDGDEHAAPVAAIGKRIVLEQGAAAEKGLELEVVGIVADTYYETLKQAPQALFYVSYEQLFRRRLTFAIRTSGPMAEIAVAVRSTLRESYPELSVIDLVPFSEHLRRSLFEEKINADVAGSIAALGLVLAMIGVASVNGYSVRRRVREIGIRMALGASSGDAFRLVLREAMLWVGAGVAVGWLAALALGQVLKSMLYGVGAHDPLTFVTVPLILVAVAVLATWLPARRAARVDPATALREE